MKQVNLNALRVFSLAASHGNLQHAADALGLSRGAVSQRIKQLEIDLGVVLLERGARGVSLTAKGQVCHAATQKALAVLETAFVDIREENNRVTLHLGPSTASKWLMPRMSAFEAAFPSLSLTTEVHERLLSRDLGRNEIAIWPGARADASPRHLSRRLTDIRLVGVCSPGFPLSASSVSLETLLTLPLLQDAYRRWDKLLAAEGRESAGKLFNFNRSALALDAAISGHGVAIAPRYMVEDDIRSGRLTEIWASPQETGEGLYISWSKDHVNGKYVANIVEWISAQFREDQHFSAD